MTYILVTEDGKFMKFYLKEVALIYKMIYGGQVLKDSDLIRKKLTPHFVE
jgi:hypothetical protein